MMQDARGVAGTLTEACHGVYEHGPAAADAPRQHGEHLDLELYQDRRPGAPRAIAKVLRDLLTRASRCEDESWTVTLSGAA